MPMGAGWAAAALPSGSRALNADSKLKRWSKAIAHPALQVSPENPQVLRRYCASVGNCVEARTS